MHVPNILSSDSGQLTSDDEGSHILAMDWHMNKNKTQIKPPLESLQKILTLEVSKSVEHRLCMRFWFLALLKFVRITYFSAHNSGMLQVFKKKKKKCWISLIERKLLILIQYELLSPRHQCARLTWNLRHPEPLFWNLQYLNIKHAISRWST